MLINSLTFKKARRLSLVWACVLLLPLICASEINFDKLLDLANLRYGEQARNSFVELQALMAKLQSAPEEEKLRKINDFVNTKIRFFDDDMKIWGKSDYWATPLEAIGKQSGDCEDYSITKYLFLRELGVSNDKLKLTYVRAQIGGPSSKIFQAHMVLSYFPEPNAQPLILDNMIGEVRIASRRSDLKPIFTFNSEGLWVGGASTSSGDSTAHLSRWRNLLMRAKDEGIEQQ